MDRQMFDLWTDDQSTITRIPRIRLPPCTGEYYIAHLYRSLDRSASQLPDLEVYEEPDDG